jgi:hypothetical protein
VSKFLVTKETKPVETLVLPAPAARPNKVAANEFGLCAGGAFGKRPAGTKAKYMFKSSLLFQKFNL